jgi:hypothetical protein
VSSQMNYALAQALIAERQQAAARRSRGRIKADRSVRPWFAGLLACVRLTRGGRLARPAPPASASLNDGAPGQAVVTVRFVRALLASARGGSRREGAQ